jgi:uncharacterized protein
MKPVFVDTSFYAAILNPRDFLYTAAEEIAKKYCGDLLTTEYVLIEVGNFMARSGDRRFFLELLGRLKRDKHTIIVPASTYWFDLGLDLYSRRLDKNWSLTDCISFSVMQTHSLNEALTADHHFEQAGYKILLKPMVNG